MADLVRSSRRAQRLTQEKLSHLTGLSTATLRRIEHGESIGVRVTTRVALERALGLPAGTLSAAARRSTEVAS
ncbi:MAG: multiprotein-bridging factor 1 family protein [Acidimicrobiia bacterium]